MAFVKSAAQASMAIVDRQPAWSMMRPSGCHTRTTSRRRPRSHWRSSVCEARGGDSHLKIAFSFASFLLRTHQPIQVLLLASGHWLIFAVLRQVPGCAAADAQRFTPDETVDECAVDERILRERRVEVLAWRLARLRIHA